MSKGILLAVAGVMMLGGVTLAAERGGLLGSGDSPPGLLASDVRLAPGNANAQEAPPIEVLGEPVDCSPAGAGPEDTQQRYDEQAGNFRVVGTLTSFDAATVAVNGPTGPITATLAQRFDLRGDLSPGSIVDVVGTVAPDGTRTAHEVRSACASAGVIDCASVTDPHFQLTVEASSFQVTGRLESVTDAQIRVLGPGLVVEISRDAGTQIEGGLDTGDPVRVEGTVLSDRQLRALTVALRCAEAANPTPQATRAPSPTAPTTAAADANDDDDCDSGPGTSARLRVEVDDGEVDLKRGVVLSSNAGSVTVDSPAGPVVVTVNEDTEVDGDLASAVEVRVQGEIQDDDSILASEIRVLCRAGQNDGDEDDDGGGDDGDEGESQGNGRNDDRSNEDDEGGNEDTSGDDESREGGDEGDDD